jgi:hypothetical protein
MLMSDPDAATAQWITTVPPLVCSVANATGDALPVALVSEVMLLAVAVPLDDAPNAVALKGSVATAVPGEATDEGLMRNTKLPLVPISAVTASVAAFRAAVLWVTAIGQFLRCDSADQFDFFDLAGVFASDLQRKTQFTRLSLQLDHAKNFNLYSVDKYCPTISSMMF